MKIGRRRGSTNRFDNDFVRMNPSKNKGEMFRGLVATIETTHEAIVQKTAEYKSCLQRATKENFVYNGTFHEAVGPESLLLVLIVGQIFGIMPVQGVKSKDAGGLSFSWFAPATIYSIIVGIFLFIYLILTIYFVFSQPLKLSSIDPLIFYGSIFCVHCTFEQLATKWPKLMQQWDEIERRLPEFHSQLEKAELAQKIKMIALVTLMMSLSEHVLSVITIVHYANYCNAGKDPVQQFFEAQLSQMFYVMEFSAWKAFFGKILNVIATFAWTYMDLFVMIVSVGLRNTFRRVNASLFRMKGKVTSEQYWTEHRGYYRSLCVLCDDIDNAISFITIMSFSNNLFYICVQLLRSINEMPSFAHAVYFYFSLFFLIGRALAVSLYSAGINDESKMPVRVFRCVPRESWCLEVKRFSEEVNTDVVALSGLKFFHLTRGLVLTVAGTVVTYELVLIQFHVEEKHANC